MKQRYYWLALLSLLSAGTAHSGVYPLDTYAVYDDQSSDPNDIGRMYLYTGSAGATSFQVNSVALPNTNINTGGVVASGAAVGPYQPAVDIGPFSESYFQISSSSPMNGLIEDPLFIDGNDQDTFVNAADTNTYVGTVFMAWLRSCSGCSNSDFGDDLAVINSGANAITAVISEWAGTPPAGAWGGALVTSPSIPSGGVWMWSPDTAASGLPVNQSGGTQVAQAGNYKVVLSGPGLFYFGDDFTDYQGSGSNRNDLAHMMPDMNTGREVGTDLVGPNDWRDDSCANADMIITNEGATNANFTVEYLVQNTLATSQWPVSALVPDNTWQADPTATNVILAPGASYPYSNDVAGRKWATFFQVVSNNGVLLNAWGGVGPLHNNFDGGGYMDSADQQSPWGTLFKWGLGNGSGNGTSAAQVLYAIAPVNNTTVTFSTTSGTLTTPLTAQTNTSGGPAGLRYVLNDTACPDDYYASVTANQNVYAFDLSQALSNPSGGSEQLYSIPPPNLTQVILSKTANPTTVNVGGTVTYTLVASNDSLSTMTDVSVSDQLPTNDPATFTYSSYTISGGTATVTNPSTGDYVWTIGNLAAGASVTITVTTTATSGLNGEVVPNVATADNSTDNPSSSQNAPVTIVIPGLNLQKLASPSTASPGNTVTYTLDYLADCPAPLTGTGLSLEVESSSLGATNMQYNFELANTGSAPINLNEVQIVYWLYDPSLPAANITFNDYYGGNATPFVPGWSPPNWAGSAAGITPVTTRPDGLNADLQVTWSNTSAEVLPAGVTDSPIQLDLELESAPPDFSLVNQYSYTTSASFVSDLNFAVYYDGQLVQGCPPTDWVTVSDTVPSTITYVSSSPTATLTGNVLSWFDSCIQCQSNVVYTWSGTVNSNADCVINDQADFTSDTIVGVSNLATVVVPCGTSSPTPTASPTATASPTRTPTATASSTSTPTSTLTLTYTDTPFGTPTVTPTVTATSSATPTATQTVTWTDTPSATPTPSVTFTATQTVTWTDTPSATPTPSITFTATQTVTWTDTPSATPTPSITFTATPSPTWSATPTATQTPTATPTFTASPSFTITPTATNTPTITPTFVPAPIQVTVTLFNSAGEVVEVLYQGGAESVPAGLTLSNSLLVEGSTPLQVELGTTLSNGQNTLSWSGLNQNGQMVASGLYYIQARYTNSFGQVTSYTQNVQIASATAGTGVNIFNSAGELVWQSALPSLGVGNDTFSLSQNAVVLAYDPTTGNLKPPLVIQLQGGTPVTWYGHSLSGAPVQSGVYIVQEVTENAGGALNVFSKSVLLLAVQAAPSARVTVAPNPLISGQALEVFYTPYIGCQGTCALYTLTGGLVSRSIGASGSNTVTLQSSGLAPGIYILEFSQLMGNSPVVKGFTKIAVIH